MWLVHFLPDWIFHLVLMVSFVALVASSIISIIPYRQIIQIFSLIFLLVSIWFEGAVSNEEAWQLKIKELEVKVAQAEAKSQETNTVIVEKVVKKLQLVRTKGDDIIKYVDREVVKYDKVCPIPEVVIKAHNEAAEAIK